MSPSTQCALALWLATSLACSHGGSSPNATVAPRPCPAAAPRNAPGCLERMHLMPMEPAAAPVYPPVQRSAGVGGRVELDFQVRRDGWVDSASIDVATSSNRAFDRSAVASVARWRFDRGSIAHDAPVRLKVIVVYVMLDGICAAPSAAALASWSPKGDRPTMRVQACTWPLLPRDQVQVPRTPPS